LRQITDSVHDREHRRLDPADELTTLFEPFERRRSPNGRSPTGFGLGLVIVQAIADAHGARITARGRPSGGLRVEVAFPLATAAARHPRL
jgi:signal transduction histidine kinase